MNTQSHRLIFNASRGCIMAVAETSRSSRKACASDTTHSTCRQRRLSSRRAGIYASNQPLALMEYARAAPDLIVISHFSKDESLQKDLRPQALASAAASGYNATDAVQKQGSVKDATTADKVGGININLSLGSSSSESHSTSQATTQRGSSVSAGGNVNIKASGSANYSDTHNGDITVAGSTIQAGNTVNLDAHSKLNLVSTQSTTQDTSSNSSSSGSVGVGYSSSAGLNVNASASESSGRGNGNSVTQNNTLIQGKQIALKSGADTTVAGAVVSADKVTANVGGNLIIESRQDTDTYQNRSSNSGGKISAPSSARNTINSL